MNLIRDRMIRHFCNSIKEKGINYIVSDRVRRLRTRRFDRYIANVVDKCPLKEDVIVFLSRPDYSDNGKALSEYMERNGFFSKYKVYWLVEDKEACEKSSPDTKAVFIKMYDKHGVYTKEALDIYLTAQYVIATHVFYVPKNQSNPQQKRFLLWHGCGYKDKGWTHFIPNNFEKVCVSGPLFIETKMRYWNINSDVIIDKGYPRYDWMLHPSERAEQYADSLKDGKKKLVIWMPTYRNAVGFKENEISGFPIISSKDEWESLDRYCSDRGIVLLLKLHIYQKPYDIDFESMHSIKLLSNKDFIVAGINMYEFLAFTDGLISDYSSVAIDYLLVDKPIAFALDDYEQYKSSRGFVFDDPLKYMPGHKLYGMSDLFDYLEDCVSDADPYKNERIGLKGIAIHVSDNYSRDILESLGL